MKSHSSDKKNDTLKAPCIIIYSSMSETVDLIRASVQGIVYFIHNETGKVYTYDIEAPIYVGVLERCTEKHLISKADGCLAGCRVRFRPDIKEIFLPA
jgi:hypothetical protein